MKKGINVGYLMTTGVLNQDKDGFSNNIKTRTTSVMRPNVGKNRFWENKLNAAFNILEKLEKRTTLFKEKMLDSPEIFDGRNPNVDNKRKVKKAKSPNDIFSDAEKSLQRMKVDLGRAKDNIIRARKNAVLSEDQQAVSIAEEAWRALDEKVKGLAESIKKMKEAPDFDSSL